MIANKENMSDSSSDEAISPPKMRRRTGRTVRNVAKLLKQQSACSVSSNEPDLSADVYSHVAQQSFAALKEGKSNVKDLLKDDVESDEFAKPETPLKSKPPGRYESHLLEDDEDDVSFVAEDRLSQRARDKSPTPPPATPILQQMKKPKNKRKMKGVKAAIQTLDNVYHKYEQEKSLKDDDDDVAIIDIVSPAAAAHDENKPVTVKIRSRSGIQRFVVRGTDDLSGVFREMAAHEAVPQDRLSIVHGDVVVQPYDTLASVNIGVADILDCYIRKDAQTHDTLENDPDAIEVTVQGKEPRSRCTVLVHPGAPLERMMRKYAALVGVAYADLAFTFDGEELSPQDTAADMDIEDGFCVDVTGV